MATSPTSRACSISSPTWPASRRPSRSPIRSARHSTIRAARPSSCRASGRTRPAPKALSWPKKALFDPIGMTSAVLEPDARGTFVGSSYLYATARDWARLGLFMLQKGVWNGKRDPARRLRRLDARGSAGVERLRQGPGLALRAGRRGEPRRRLRLPEDTYWFEGHDGQSVAVIPSKDWSSCGSA